ncbi:M1 family metallopeptidase [Bombilactobacillus bombi]|uniref:M1 family metallopeptidase n=1 Tax=Bombilactobacillus bombi TaxID=1303590 RepID=UPI0015E5B42C|nr:M1 family metallopeptidase [Bombilactobacillus bombi]MBA1435085.1 M1 family peptidase [Bombilactobacillus bombi]
MTQRLLELFKPEHYDVYLDINRQTKQIHGQTTITGEAQAAEILINQRHLQIEQVQVEEQPVAFTLDNDQEVIHINLKRTGNIQLQITYSTPLTDSMMGIYPSYYQVDGVQKQLVGTQFETTAAREAFPCVDEPAAKATFSLAIKFDEQAGEIIISNMPELRVEQGVHYFEPTVKMSTYLVAFAFGELQSKLTQTKSGVEIGVFATKAHQAKELDFALDIAKRSIEFYEDFYQTPYPLSHSYQLALPDFSAGAMENWGLVTYREAYLLLDPDNASLDLKGQVATVIAHELAHQWFGDLVTMQWWDDLWLNESFANMMEYVAIAALEPDWHIWETFQTTEAPMALQRDAIDGVQPVHVQVEHPADIDSIFDSAIVYAKGARMLVMVRALIGDEALRAGLKAYFTAHQYGNATGADLWSALSQASKMNISQVMNTWLEQPGYPVVKMSVDNGNLHLEQEQFFIGEGQAANRQWQIPLKANIPAAPQIMQSHDLDLGNYQQLRKKVGQPLRLNVGNESHFIVQYDKTLLQDILKNADNLDAISQLQILQDLLLLAQSKAISYAELVPLLPKFAQSKAQIVNAVLYRIIGNLKYFVDPTSPAENNLKILTEKLSTPQVQRLGWLPRAEESNDDQLTRPYILDAAIYAENAESKKAAHQLFSENSQHLINLPAAIRMYVLKNEIKNFTTLALFKQLLGEYQTSADANYKHDLCTALTQVPDIQLLKQLISKFKDSNVIKPQDLRSWFAGVLANPQGEQLAWDWLRNQWNWLVKTVGGDMEFTTYITVTSRVFKTAQRLAEFKEFFEPKINTPGLTREIKMDIDVITGRVQLVSQEQKSVNTTIAQVIA